MIRAPKTVALILLLCTTWYVHAEVASFSHRLPVPPLLEDISTDPDVVRFRLTADEATHSFLPDLQTPTYGFNGTYLGPTIRAARGQKVEIEVTNSLSETTTVHWHGLHIPGEMDGGPHQTIEPGATWRPYFVIEQQAATLWYHPHQMGKTGEHVYRGLAGLFIIDDDNSAQLDLPDTYGVDDIPLIFQDKRFYTNGELAYVTGMPDVMHGVIGDYVLVNGAVEPFVEVPSGLTRFRILNGSDSTIHRYRMDGGLPFTQIASDGGFLENPIELENLVLSPGERVEVLLDFSSLAEGDELYLETDQYSGSSFRTLKFVVTDGVATAAAVPAKLNTIVPMGEEEADRTRTFTMETGGMGSFSINGRTMDMDRIDVRLPVGSTEIWAIRNLGMMNIPHSFHVHDVQFQILDINGEAPPAELAGWKDTVLLWAGDEMRIIAQYADFTGLYMYHCHLLVHEDQGMMGQFEVY
jgi:blue copper oxidase